MTSSARSMKSSYQRTANSQKRSDHLTTLTLAAVEAQTNTEMTVSAKIFPMVIGSVRPYANDIGC